jgi:hypothetical protein
VQLSPLDVEAACDVKATSNSGNYNQHLPVEMTAASGRSDLAACSRTERQENASEN